VKNIVIFASGKGSNAENIIKYFKNNSLIQVGLIVCNKSNAGVLNVAKNFNIPFLIVDKPALEQLANDWKNEKIDLIVLAGFLWQIPDSLIKALPNKILNIHPSLLPKYGGKGMYGTKVHEAVINNQEKESGITIHYVNEHYDEGEIILQESCILNKNETVEGLLEKVHSLEFKFLPLAIEKLLQ
jgi:phosphoribosylglycinamide formyltransferase-1